MQKNLPQRVHDYMEEHLHQKHWRRVVTAMACIVVFCTTYALILPAITATGDTYCGKEEHTHSEECYERVLICGQEGTDAEKSVQTGDQTESEFSDGTSDESSDGISDGTSNETPSETPDENLDGDSDETPDGTEDHVHTDACYEKKLVCQLEEHTHTLACYSNPEADVENSGVWENTIPQNLGDNWAENVVAVAKSQLGYTESTANYTVLEDGTTMKGYTRYGEWYGSPYDDWSAMFVSFCLNYAGVPNTSVPYASDCADWINQLQNAGLYKSAAECIPEQGFPVFFDTDGDGAADYAGIVTGVSEDGATLSIIEGDITDAVVQRSCSTGDGTILGYCVLPENPDAKTDETVSDGEDKTADETASDGEDKTADETVSDGEDKTADETASDGEDKTADETTSEDDIMTAEVLEDDVVDSGTFESVEGTTMTWKVTMDSSGEYTITISGKGEMPSFLEKTLPWRSYSRSSGRIIKDLIFEDGITKIGAWSFSGFNIRHLTIAESVKTIGGAAFYLCSYLEDNDLEIPGTVSLIDGLAFAGTPLSTIILNEGTTEIGPAAFWGASNAVIYIPSTVTKIGNKALRNISKFVVAENSQYFATDKEGIALYTKDGTVLWGFAQGKYMSEYVIPNGITQLTYGVLETDNCEKVVIPRSATYAWSSINGQYKEIIFEDGEGTEPLLEINGYYWGGNNSDNLVTYRLPRNRKLVLGQLVRGNWPNVTDFEIPDGVTSFKANLTDGSMLGLERLRYNAKNATFEAAATTPCGPDASFALTIGNEVDTLAEGFSYFVNHATSFVFEPNNQITIAEGAFANAPAPLTGLSGTVYVDSQGVVYSYDASASTAKLVYVPGNVTEVTIPETIAPEDGVTCTVTSVGSNALCLAEKLKAITFKNPETITEIGAYGLANCPSLTSVNGKETEEEASVSFTNAAKGYGILVNTGLEGSSGSGMDEGDMNGSADLKIEEEDKSYLEIKVSSRGETLEWKENEGGNTGGYTLLTGDTMTITVAAGNTQGNTKYVYRVYLRKSGEDCALNFTPGETYTFNDNTVGCYATDDPNIIYLKFVPGIGNTLSFPVTAVYPSPGSAGGGLTIWGEVLTADEAQEKTGADVPEDGNRIDAFWKTQRDPYELTKNLKGGASTNIIIAEDDEARPESSLVWTVSLNRGADTTSAYGKDVAKSVDFTDQLTLPTGLSWSETVLDAAKDGDIRTKGNDIYAGDTKIATIAGNSGSNWSGRGVTLSEDKQNLIFRWKSTNTSRKTELGSTSGTITIYPEALEFNSENLTEDSVTLTNTANATVHYTYSADDTLKAGVDRQLTPQKGALTLSKSAEGGYYFGEDITYTVTLKNNGLTDWTGDADSYLVRDTLSTYSYISPENMEKMFGDEIWGAKLTITISNATLAAWEKVSATEGEKISYRTSGNSDIGTSGQTLTIEKSENGYTVAVKDGNTYTGTTAAEALQKAGYAVSVNAAYTCEWELENTISKSAEYTFMVYATAKDTFGMLWKDWPGEYTSNQAVSVINWARLIGRSNNKETVLKSTSAQTKTHREAVISKSVYDENNNKLNGYTVSDGAILNYQLDFTHYGSGEYDNLPMVDDLYGSQYLLVPKEQNPGLADKELKTKEYNGVAYYILTEGEYTDIVVGKDDEENWLTAATVTVTKTDEEQTEEVTRNSYTGIHTQIKWYFAHLDGGHYRKSVRYQAVEDLSITGISYSLGNIVWMNDRKDDRIYASVAWGDGTLIKYDKSIVETKGDAPTADMLDEDDYSMIAPGDKVTYRLTLESDTDTAYTIKGEDLVDMLPETYDVFEWEKDTNISLEINCTENVKVTGIENWILVDEEETKIGLTGGRQCMTWPEDTTISFNGKGAVYLYITLTFPTDTEDTGDTWSKYAAANAGMRLDNTLYVYRFPDSVEHDLKESGKALLQKGVLAQTIYGGNTFYATGSDRQSYANNDGNSRAVFYYVALYNDGNKRLYLNDLQDKLPTGFTYLRMLPGGSQVSGTEIWTIANTDSITTECGKSSKLIDFSDLAGGAGVTYRSAVVTAVPSEDKTGITFQIAGGSGEYALKYDEKQQQYYLDRNEGLVFAYAADVGTVEKTEDIAVNTVAMPYTDHLSTGVTQPDKTEVAVNAVTSDRFSDYNDGDRKIMSSDTVRQQYGFTGEETNWFVSSVSLERGKIVPGITKYTESYTSKQSGVTYDYKNSVGPDDTVNWCIRVQNTGTVSMTDYTVTDVMPKPYVFTGEVKYTIYDSQGRSLSTGSLLSFNGTRTSEDASVSIENKWYSGTLNLELDGTEAWLGKNGDEVSVAMKRDKISGNESLSLHIKTLNRSIPEGGYMDITFSSVNPTKNYTNSVYVNHATVTPNQQTFTNAGQGSIVRDSSGKAVSVRNSSPVTVTFGYATTSEKSVTEVGNESNTAVSTDMDKNWIMLPSADSEFRYTLTVNNDTDWAMKKLVLIDNLPQTGDCSPFDTTAERNSEFDVNFAENPDIKVTVTDENGTSSVLDGKYYTVEYSNSTDFGGQQSADWKGENTGKWTATSANARSLRIIIKDEGGTQIPAKATVSASFNAVAGDDAEPGKVAWNSFGYHYGLAGPTAELEAMPLTVGVKIPSVPTLKKQLVDNGNQSVKADKVENFTFLIYEGEALNGYDTEEALTAALNEAGRTYMKKTLTVEAGASESDAVTLKPGDGDDFQWKEGQKYTAVELTATTEQYHLSGFVGANKNITFTYHAESDTNLVCRNMLWQWKINLVKVDSTTVTEGSTTIAEDSDTTKLKKLPGAVFCLYSPDEPDEQDKYTIPDKYSNLSIQSEIIEGDTTWYLCSVQTTDENGTISWEKLGQEKYYLLEVKAPDGYKLPENPGQILTRSGAVQNIYNITVKNTPGYALPETGGAGTLPYTIGGTLLLAGSLLSGYVLRRKRERRFAK